MRNGSAVSLDTVADGRNSCSYQRQVLSGSLGLDTPGSRKQLAVETAGERKYWMMLGHRVVDGMLMSRQADLEESLQVFLSLKKLINA